MIYYKIQAKEESSAKQIARTLKNSRTWVRSNGDSLELYSATGNDHVSHVRGIAQQFNAVAMEISKEDIPASVKEHGGIPKREYKAFDGTTFTDKNLYAQYERNNNPKLKDTRAERWQNIINAKAKQGEAQAKREYRRRASKCRTIARLEAGCNLDVEGVLTSLKALEDRLLEAYNTVSEARTKVEKIGDIDKLLKDRNDYLASAKLVLAKF